MPCYRCGVRQTDPSRGQSPWKRGVRRDSQVLICPSCQASHDWMAELSRCPQCASVHLVRRLGEVECRDCGAIVPPSAGLPVGETLAMGDLVLGDPALGDPELVEASSSPGLSEEVAQALDRVLGRGLVSQSAPRTGADSR
jgi:hypothetical protein